MQSKSSLEKELTTKPSSNQKDGMRAAFLIPYSLLHIECVDIEAAAGQAGGCAIQVHAPYPVVVVHHILILHDAQARDGRVHTVREVEVGRVHADEAVHIGRGPAQGRGIEDARV